jgi:hypothetical protein
MFRRRHSYGKVSKTDKAEQFLLFDSKDIDKILMFATRRNLDFLIKSQEGLWKAHSKSFLNYSTNFAPSTATLMVHTGQTRKSTYVKIFEHIRKIMEKIEVINVGHGDGRCYRPVLRV